MNLSRSLFTIRRMTHPIVVILALLISISAYGEAKINAIEFSSGAESFEVLIKGEGNLKHGAANLMENPLRVQLDFPNTIGHFRGAVEAPENPYISRIWLGVKESDPKTTTVTAEMKWKFVYAVEADKNIVVLRVYSRTWQSLKVTPESELKATPDGTQKIEAPPAVVAAAPFVPADSTPNSAPNNDMVIGPDDLVDISVFQLPEFSLSTRVLADGSITMPLVGSIEIAGLTRTAAEKKISEALTAQKVNNPSVSVSIKEYKSRQVSVLGSVKLAGIYYLTSNRSLLQLISEAGGLTGEAGTTCYIFRGGSKIEIDLYDLMQNGNQRLNVAIQPGDVINVPVQPKTFAYVLGAVRSPGAVDINPKVPLTLAGAIARAGGPSRLADLSDIQIKRKDENGAEKIIKANLKDILKGKVPDITILPDDLINVKESFF